MRTTIPSVEESIPRRTFAKRAGALTAALLLIGAAGNLSAGTRVVLLGTSGGPTWWPDSQRMGISSALVVQDTNANDHIYVIDLGPGASQRLAEAFNAGTYTNFGGVDVQTGYSSFLKQVRALFFTHLHMDHTADFPTLLLCGQGAGLLAYPDSEADKRLQVFGPGRRGQLDDIYPPGRTNVPPTLNPLNPTPGTMEMMQYLLPAYAQTINNFTRDSGWSDFSKLLSMHDIPFPQLPRADYPIDPQTGQARNTAPWPEMDPIFVYQDEFVRVTATLGDHGPVYPNFAYRFDTADGSVVFSGDTGYPCTNLIRLAQGADIMVHEVIDQAFIDNLFPPPLTPVMAAMKYHLESSHTSITNVGKQAAAANVGTLVLNHIVPANTAAARLQQAQQNFAGTLIVGSDLTEIPVGAPSNLARPVAADFDGDAKADPATAASGDWYAWLSADAYARSGPYQIGGAGLTPCAADFDGDRLADPAVYSAASGDWTVMFSATGYAPMSFPGFLGGIGFAAAPADFDGDGLGDPAVYRAATGEWRARLSASGYTEVSVIF